MKKISLLFIAAVICTTGFAQEKLYNPAADASKDLKAAIKKAAAEKKYVLIQAGGNWCSWCIEFARLAKATPKIDSALNAG